MKRFKASRDSIKFEFEFADGSIAEFEYLEPNTKQIEAMAELGDDNLSVSEVMERVKTLLNELIIGDPKLKKAMLKELETNGNIYDFNSQLSEELGKLKKRGSKG